MVKHKGQLRAHPAVWARDCHARFGNRPGKTVDSDQNTERRRWDGEEVHRRNGLAIVSEKRQPSVHGIWISRGSPDRLRDTPFRDVETQFDHFAVNARCSLGRILGNHTEDQGANLFAINM